MLLFFVICLFGGGSNLPTAPGLILLRPVSIVVIAACVLSGRRLDETMRLPLWLLAALTISIAIQLAPIPSSIWWQLPGRSDFVTTLFGNGDDIAWRPISVAPSLTCNSLLATLPGWAVVLAYAQVPPGRDQFALWAIIGAALMSSVVGLLQLAGGHSEDFYLYGSDGTISGLLANRNHQATLLAIALPLLRVWVVRANPGVRIRHGIIALLLGGVFLGMIFLTGSRSGIVAGLLGIIAAFLIAPTNRSRSASNALPLVKFGRFAIIMLPIVLLVLLVASGRDLSIQRLFNADYANEIRLRGLPTTIAILWHYFPIGSGYGTFDTVFRIHEPSSILNPTFFNHAHNDYLELAITGGVLPFLLLLIALGWIGSIGFRLVVREKWSREGVVEARAGLAILIIVMIASVSDYPLRPPLMTVVAAIAFCWMARANRSDHVQGA
jgi:O-antigen ligase